MTEGQTAKAKGVVDIVFLIDATGSMAPCIDALKENIRLFIDHLTGEKKSANAINPVKDWRGRVVGYRDFEEDGEPLVDNDFVSNADQLKSQLAALTADGGGDEPESLLDALHKISTMEQTAKGAPAEPRKWRYRSSAARVVVVFTDAPYKETLAAPDVKGGGFDDVTNAVTSGRIILSIFAPDMECYNKLGSIDKAEFLPIPVGPEGAQAALVKFTSDLKNFQETLKQLAASVSASAATETLLA